MGLPVPMCSSPSSSIIAVPEAALFPRTFRRIASSKALTRSVGKPSG